MDTNLAKRVLKTAENDGLPDDHPMVIAAKEFEAAAHGFFSEPKTVSVKKFLGKFAKARRLWCEYSGDPLV